MLSGVDVQTSSPENANRWRPPSTMLYLDTSAIRHLADEERYAALRGELVRRAAFGPVFCTSILALEEIFTSTRENPQARDAAFRLLRQLVPEGVLWHWHPVVRQWVSAPTEFRPSPCWETRPWSALGASIREQDVIRMREEQEKLQDGAQRFRDAVARDLTQSGHLDCSAEKASFWANPASVVQKAGELSDYLFGVRGNLAALMHSLGRVSDADACWKARGNLWVRMCARHLVIGVVRRVCGRTSDNNLRGELYDNIHIAFSSVADGIVTQDRWLRRSVSMWEGAQQRHVALSLDDLPAALDTKTG